MLHILFYVLTAGCLKEGLKKKFLERISSNVKTKKKIDLYIYNFDKIEENKLLQVINKEDFMKDFNVNINVYKIIDKK